MGVDVGWGIQDVGGQMVYTLSIPGLVGSAWLLPFLAILGVVLVVRWIIKTIP